MDSTLFLFFTIPHCLCSGGSQPTINHDPPHTHLVRRLSSQISYFTPTSAFLEELSWTLLTVFRILRRGRRGLYHVINLAMFLQGAFLVECMVKLIAPKILFYVTEGCMSLAKGSSILLLAMPLPHPYTPIVITYTKTKFVTEVYSFPFNLPHNSAAITLQITLLILSLYKEMMTLKDFENCPKVVLYISQNVFSHGL